MIFRAGGGEGGDDIYIPGTYYLRKEGKISASSPTTLGTLVLFLSPQVRKSPLNPSFQHYYPIFSDPADGGQIQVLNTTSSSSDFQSPDIRYYLPVLTLLL